MKTRRVVNVFVFTTLSVSYTHLDVYKRQVVRCTGGVAMSTAPQIRTALLENLRELHLPAMRDCFEQTAQRAEKETLSYEQYLLELAERECEARRRNRIAKLQRESGLPREKTLANFDLKRLPTKVGRQLKVLLDGSFLDRKENLLLFGNPGAGKSHLLCALAQELIAQGRRMKYTSCAMLVQELSLIHISYVLTEVVGIQLFLMNVLSPLSRGEHLTPEQYQTIIKSVQTSKSRVTQELVAKRLSAGEQ